MALLPPLPGHRLELIEDVRPPKEEQGFIYVRKLRMKAHYADGSESQPFQYFCADRSRMDAAIIVPHFTTPDGIRHVVLRSALRPPLAARPLDIRPVPELDSLGELWEVPAGLVEADERTPEGLQVCAARELFEETGYELQPSEMIPLGPSTFPAAGMIGERHFFFHAEVDPTRRVPPPEDGSALERSAHVISFPLEVALEACRRGEIEDAKTEVGLRRLREL